MIVPKAYPLTLKLDCVNWPGEFPEKPDVSLQIWHSGNALHIIYKVDEPTVRAEEGTPGNYVYKDSCVEFFFRPDLADPHYYNFEWNAIGTLFLARRTGRQDPELAPEEVLAMVKAHSSEGSKPFAERPAKGPWTLEVEIPVEALWHHEIKSFDGVHAAANFYKCGDGLSVPHYVTWAPISADKPDYHRPEFFAALDFES